MNHLSFANSRQEAAVGPFGADRWLELEGLAASVTGVLQQAGDLPAGVSGIFPCAVPAAQAYARFGAEHAEQFTALVAGIRDGRVTVDWQRAGDAGTILRRALAVAHPWPTQAEEQFNRNFFPLRKAPRMFGVVGGMIDWIVPRAKCTPELASLLRGVGFDTRYGRDTAPAAMARALDEFGAYLSIAERQFFRLELGRVKRSVRRRLLRRAKVIISPTAALQIWSEAYQFVAADKSMAGWLDGKGARSYSLSWEMAEHALEQVHQRAAEVENDYRANLREAHRRWKLDRWQGRRTAPWMYRKGTLRATTKSITLVSIGGDK